MRPVAQKGPLIPPGGSWEGIEAPGIGRQTGKLRWEVCKGDVRDMEDRVRRERNGQEDVCGWLAGRSSDGGLHLGRPLVFIQRVHLGVV